MRKSSIFILIVLSLFFTGGCLTTISDDNNEPVESLVVEKGDTVLINYIQRVYDSKALVATSYENIAKDPQVAKAEGYEEAEGYGPINIHVGSGINPPVESGLLGAQVGDEKEILIPPEDAYGNQLAELIRVIPRVAILQKIVEVPRTEFDKSLEVGEYVALKYWQARVIEVTDEYVALRNEPEDGSTVQTNYGPAVVAVNATHVTTTLTPEVDSTLETPFGKAKVMDYDDETVTLDHNHPLAGKTLLFEVRVEAIEKPK